MIDKSTLQAIFNAIRTSFKHSDRYKSILSAQISKVTGPRGGKLYKCEKCLQSFKAAEIELNHIEPVCALDRRWHSYSVEEYYLRVFTLPVEAICKSCHGEITKAQNKIRAINKKSAKGIDKNT